MRESGKRFYSTLFTKDPKTLPFPSLMTIHPPQRPLIMNRLRIRRHRRLHARLGQRRLRVTRPPHILARGPILNRQHPLRNHLPRVRPHDVDPQYPVRLRVREELDHSLRLQVRLGPRVGRKGETAGFVLDALLLQLGLVLAHPRDFRVRVHDGRDGVVVDVAVALFDELDGRDAFLFGFVREHGAEGAVADDADVGELGAVLFVDDEAAFVVDFKADVLEAEAGGVRAAADGYEDDVGVELGDY